MKSKKSEEMAKQHKHNLASKKINKA